MKTEKVYCVNCHHYHAWVSRCGEAYYHCDKVIGMKDTPVNMVRVYASMKEDNAYNDCKYYSPKPVKHPKAKWWRRLFRI